jgi:tRNA 5-methylaminomethyl-2-thiouridine biosynthesis bifunctional protein
MATLLTPAKLQLRQDGIPFSADFDDIYHSEAGGIGQAEYVFIKGNDLPRRWSGRTLFSIFETGFGLGLNFLATWAHWRRDPLACTRLHFVSVEKHPFSRDDLQAYLSSLHRSAAAHLSEAELTPLYAALVPLAQMLCEQWPVLVPGMHRLEFDGGRVVLTLIFGDALKVLPTLSLRADAFYLDGFSPAKNPALWSTPIFKCLTRFAAPGASIATYTIAAAVRNGLVDAGFVVDRTAGYTFKRDMLIGRFVPRYRVRRHEPPAPFEQNFPGAPRHLIVIGAGLAGCAVAASMAARGWQVTLLERHPAPAAEASGNPGGVFHPMITRDDSFAARLSRSGFLHALQSWTKLLSLGLQFNLHDEG